ITDNGVGMSPELIRRVLSDEAAPSADFFRQVGINNVNQRIRYAFGEDYGISIDSVEGEYTTMTITLPYRLKE
ncbi:MAG: sensor histidine kinase, partial [Clostridium sp.]|nr:sensor histidine kinase [Clostridium sp.]